MIDFVGIAQDVSNDPFVASFGVLADFSPASVLAIDCYLDELWGTDGKLKEDPAWKLTERAANLVWLYGTYVGESIRRAFGGQWEHDPKAALNMAAVQLPSGWSQLPLNKMLKRLQNGAEDAIYPLYEFAREKCGRPLVDEKAGFDAQIA